MIAMEPHPLLAPRTIVAEFSEPVAAKPSPPWLVELLAAGAPSPFEPVDDGLRSAVRGLLRHGGFKPTGRSKPASEYLARTAEEGGIASINAAVDLGNVVSLKSGFPVSVVDLAKAVEPLRVAIAGPGDRYVFNASGQEIDLEGLLCLFDAQGPCANAVKDAQRTKTDGATTRTLTVIWGVQSHEARVEAAARWCVELVERLGGATSVPG